MSTRLFCRERERVSACVQAQTIQCKSSFMHACYQGHIQCIPSMSLPDGIKQNKAILWCWSICMDARCIINSCNQIKPTAVVDEYVHKTPQYFYCFSVCILYTLSLFYQCWNEFPTLKVHIHVRVHFGCKTYKIISCYCNTCHYAVVSK